MTVVMKTTAPLLHKGPMAHKNRPSGVTKEVDDAHPTKVITEIITETPLKGAGGDSQRSTTLKTSLDLA